MAKTITEEAQIEELLTRGVEQIYPDKETLKKKLLKGERLRLYCGFDPTAASLHIGNAIQINKLAQFQKLGHEVIFLIGDFTGMIGDPTDKESVRKKLTREEVLANSKSYQAQASGYLDFAGDNPAQVKHNSEWNDKLSFKEVIELASNFTVQQMLAREMFQQRLQSDKPIYLHEFLYPLVQGYDSVAMDVDLEVGGNDQMFNMMCGRDLLRSLKNKEKFVMTLKLLADDQGKKMGKSEGNAVFLDQAPEDMFGRVMSWDDGVIERALELCTQIPQSEIEQIIQLEPMEAKKRLAFEVVKINQSQQAAEQAQAHFERTVQKKEAPEEIEELKVKAGTSLVELLASSQLAPSKSEAKRLIKQGGVKLAGKDLKDPSVEVSADWQGRILKVGKRNYRKLEF